jgi:hypothetical protein
MLLFIKIWLMMIQRTIKSRSGKIKQLSEDKRKVLLKLRITKAIDVIIKFKECQQ